MKIKITSDSTCDLSPELLRENDIELFPLFINKGDESFRDGVDIQPADIFAHVAAGGALCSTAAVPVGVFHDRFAELTRASLCGKYQGHTAQMVKEVFKQNKGGTIFIDEAYSLASDERDSFGAEAIDEIIVGLENDPGTVVIFAGYPEKMEQFLDANPGLRSRIPYRVRFCDYTADELLEISGKIAADSGFTITADAGEKLLGIFEKERQVRDFGNGRFCRSLVESAIRRKSVRLGVMDADDLSAYLDPARYSDEELFSLDGNCFTYSAAGEDRAARRIGFLG